MADGMTVSFLLYLLNEKEGFGRHGKLLTETDPEIRTKESTSSSRSLSLDDMLTRANTAYFAAAQHKGRGK